MLIQLPLFFASFSFSPTTTLPESLAPSTFSPHSSPVQCSIHCSFLLLPSHGSSFPKGDWYLISKSSCRFSGLILFNLCLAFKIITHKSIHQLLASLEELVLGDSVAFLLGLSQSLCLILLRCFFTWGIPEVYASPLIPALCVCAKLLQSCPMLGDPMHCSPPGSSAHGILQARILEWAAMPSSRGSSQPRNWTHVSYVSCIAGRFFNTNTAWEAPIPAPPKAYRSKLERNDKTRKLLITKYRRLHSTTAKNKTKQNNNNKKTRLSTFQVPAGWTSLQG